MKETERGLAADINVTPMIDVLLVLLVIFILVPRNRPVLDVNIPADRGSVVKPLPQIVLELRGDRSYAINGTPIAKQELQPRLAQIYATRPMKVLFIRAAPGWRYGEVIEAANVARGAGVQVIGYAPPSGRP